VRALIEVVLLHRPGPDREAIVSFLAKAGMSVSLDAPALGRAPDAVWVIEAPCLVDLRGRAVPAERSIVLGGPAEALPGARRLPESFYFSDLEEAVRATAEGRDAAPARKPTPAPPPDTRSLLLRGLAHALANPLGGAAGWLQLLAADLPAEDPRSRAITQARADLHRLDQMLQMMGWIGDRSEATRVPIDLAGLFRERAARVRGDGLPVDVRFFGPPAVVEGDPVPFHLAVDALLTSFLEERSRAQAVSVEGTVADGLIEVEISDQGGTIPRDLDLSDLGLTLRQARGPRVLALHLLQGLCARREGRLELVPRADQVKGARIRFQLRMQNGGAGQDGIR
jgi:signal transduction histidine kinase